jgi:CubicO group peptidase (beta-lactamase class C family)
VSTVCLVFWLLIGGGGARIAISQEAGSGAYDFTPVSATVNRLYKHWELPGAALLVYTDGEVVYEEYFGSYDQDTIVSIASSTKWLSGATIMSLVDDGLIDLVHEEVDTGREKKAP